MHRATVAVAVLLAGGIVLSLVSAAGTKEAGAHRQMARVPEEYRLVFQDDFEAGRLEKRWRLRETSEWRVEMDAGGKALFLAKPGAEPPIRSPFSYALIKGKPVRDFVLTFRARCLTSPDVGGRDVLAVFGYRDEAHYYYVHFAKTPDPIHNAILIVNGKPREALPLIGDSIGKLVDTEYHLFKVERNATTGDIRAYVDDMGTPILQARDTTFARGLVGIGSFDDTAYFDDVRLYGL